MPASRRRRAFTLLELIVVVAVLGVLAAIAVPTFARVEDSARTRTLEATADGFLRSLDALVAASGGSSPTLEDRRLAMSELTLSSSAMDGWVEDDGTAVFALDEVELRVAADGSYAGAQPRGFLLASNGVTVTCAGEPVGASGMVAGVMYTKRDRSALLSLAAAGDSDGLASSCTSGVSDMSSLFSGRRTLNPDISSWDTSSVTSLLYTFSNADAFNAPIGAWDTSNVTDMFGVFAHTDVFNQDISSWDTTGVTRMAEMFWNAAAFDQDISSWDTSTVTNMAYMFSNADAFTGDITGWDVSNVTSMHRMFQSNDTFNQDLSSWCVPLIASKPPYFDSGASSWVLPRPVWGTCPQ